MRTIILERPGRLVRAQRAPPGPPADGEALVRVRRVGICGTDLHAFAGRQPFFDYPRILGHELAVEVVAVGPGVERVQPGQRAAVEPYLPCGACQACRRARPNCCARLQVLGVHVDGGMRELLRVPAARLHPCAQLGLDELALVEMLAVGAHAVGRAAVGPGDTALVVGAGPIGLAVLQHLRLDGARVLVADRSARRLDLCAARFAPDGLVDAREPVLPQVCRQLGGELPTVVFEATGSAASMMASFGYVAGSGCLVFVGFVPEEITFADPEFHRREVSLLASRNALRRDFEHCLQRLRAGCIRADQWITHRLDWTTVAADLPDLLDPEQGALKAVLEI
ncbi:MAG: zinc-binding alcohol dehydrogenase family protein [Candidatus Latescibacterota bacterium]